MKARVRFIILMAVCLFVFLLASCGEENIASRSSTTMDNPDVSSTHIGDSNDVPHTHVWKEERWVEAPTCTETGRVQKKCGCGYTTEEDVAPLGHMEEILAKKEPSCTEEGLTEGKKCTVCGVVTLEQQVIGTTEHSYVLKEGFAATCTEWGRTDGKECTACGKIYLYQVIPPKGHLVRIVDGIKATCTTDGMTMGKECVTCGEVLLEQETIPAKGHTKQVIEAKQPTCTKRGSTEGVVCTDCGKTIVPAQSILPLGHKEKEVDQMLPTCTEAGREAGVVCATCGMVLFYCEEIPPTGHTPTATGGKEPTCTEYGYTSCIECAVCQVLLDFDGILEPTGHQFGETHCNICGALRESQGLKYTLNYDGTAYTVSGIGTCEDEHIIIPSTYEGLPVTKIGMKAFERNETIKSVYIPEGVTYIDFNAFFLCSSMTSIYLPSTIKELFSPFTGCINLQSVYIADLAKWCEIEFSVTDSNPLMYAKELYVNGELVTDIIIPDTVTKINNGAFYFVEGTTIKSVTIPNTVKEMEECAFEGDWNGEIITIYCQTEDNLAGWDVDWCEGDIDVRYTEIKNK